MLLKGVRNGRVIQTDNLMEKNEFKRSYHTEIKTKWREKRMYGQFVREMSEEVDKELSWQWITRGDLKVQTEATIFAAQEQALRTNYVKNKIDKTPESPLCRMCGERGETVQHIVCECSKLAQREYKRRHDNIAKLIHWMLCEKYGRNRTEKWYEHCPEGVVEDENAKLLWDINIQCDNVIEARRPDLTIIEKKTKDAIIIDVAVPGDYRVHEQENEKVDKYQDLKREVKRLLSLRNVKVVPVVVGALGCVSKRFNSWMETLGLEVNVGTVQKTALLGTARIIRQVLGI